MHNFNQQRKSCISGRLVFHLILVFLYLALIACKIAVMNVKDWYKQGSGTVKWKGSLTEIYSSGGGIEEKSYAWLSNHYCGSYSSSCYYDCGNYEYYDSTVACSTFENLNGGGTAFIVFSSLEIVFVLAMIGFSIPAAHANKKYLCPVILFSILALVAGLVSFAVMAGTAMITFSDSCDETKSHLSSQASSCALTGPKFDLFNLLYIFTLNLIFWIYLCVLKGGDKKISQAQNANVSMTANVQTHQDQVQPPIHVFPLAVVGPHVPSDGIPIGIPYKDA
ncbi:unnamed protein product [Blepharisma stoltei]|uniref:Uncharacterized protein n=1 Tax=Blepharisma stoltei TaxID=1481888 RepID=A0AAU9JRV2_9CILI|nr:unnamed protein product [Blepharisma stoltei]